MAEAQTLEEILSQPKSIEDAGIPQNILIDIVLRLLYNEGNVSFQRFKQVIRVPFVIDSILEWMKDEHLVEILPGRSELGRYGYVYTLTKAGEARALAAMERSLYVGPAPVPINFYNQAIEMQTEERAPIFSDNVKQSLSGLILPDDFHRRIGPAVNSGSSLFLYGPSGNGKTTIAQAIANLIAEAEPIWIPYALTAGGQIIQIHDRLVHRNAPIEPGRFSQIDSRWGLFQRPSVMVGGELQMDGLDLRFDPIAKIYEAPLQLKANGGMFLIDDFGRQQVSPENLLNRWIVPLEEGVDFLRLKTGQTIVVPFRQLIVFCTNLDPYQLADDSFYRRIQMKVNVESPSPERYKEIFMMACENFGISFDQASFDHLIQKWYRSQNRELQAVHPRDLLRISRALCDYERIAPQLTPELLDEACLSYFVETEITT